MKIAIPLTDGNLAMHFGHCDHFALVDVDPEQNEIVSREEIKPPKHEPGMLPPWLAKQGANMIIAGGIGQRAQSLFVQQEIQVMVGAPASPLDGLVNDYLAGTLQLGTNFCDH